MSVNLDVDGRVDRQTTAYDRKMARWRHVVDWAKHRPWAMRAVGPLSRGTGRLRFFDRLTDRAATPPAPDLRDWSAYRVGVCWIGHATMLVRVAGLTVLTDPVFSSRVGLGWGLGTLGPARFVRPACDVDALPAVDVVLLSHAHFDHLDRPSLARLSRASTVVCAKGTRDLVDDFGFRRVVELDANQATTIEANGRSLRVTAVPVRHWGARTVLDTNRSYCAYLLESDDARVLYGADTAFQEYWKSIGAGGGVDLAIVGIGAYDPWIGGHANPEQAWEMATAHAGARRVAPMHHSTFKLSNEPMADPMRRLLAAAGGRSGDVVCRSIGDVWGVP